MELNQQVLYLFLLAIPIACISWTVTHEEVFREPREYCIRKSENCQSLLKRKFFYLFTCEYCFSHYVTIIVLIITRFQFLYTGWRGYLLAGFALVWVANIYMSIMGRLRLGIKNEKIEADLKEEKLKECKDEE